VLDLPTSKQLLLPAPGEPRRLNSLPISMAASPPRSPDGRWVVTLNAGYGTFESGYGESLAVLDTRSGTVKDVPDERVGPQSRQTFYSGLAFSEDGSKLYASMASLTDPTGDGAEKTGNGVVVYSFHDGELKPQGFLKLPMVKLAAGRRTELRPEGTKAVPYPAGIAVTPGGQLLVSEDLADAAVLLDATTGAVVHSFDLSQAGTVPAAYPFAVAVSGDGRRGFVSLWNMSEVVELDLVAGTVVRRVSLMKPTVATAPGSHPCALLLDEKQAVLYVALANRDAVAAVGVGTPAAPRLEVRGYFDTRLPGQSYFGAEPDALAMNAAGTRLYAANLGSDAVAVLDPRRLRSMAAARGEVEPVGFVPTELMPMGLTSVAGKLYVATGKGKGTGPNNFPQRVVDTAAGRRGRAGAFTYAPTLLYGSLAVLDEAAMDAGLKDSTAAVLESNRMKASAETIPFANADANAGPSTPPLRGYAQDDKKEKWPGPIRHVIYIIKENRTYDQVFGDLAKDGRPVGNGDPSLTMYGAAITPNQHKLALQFGVLDNFYDSAEVSGDGHVWSNAAIGTDYLEKTWQQDYSRAQHTYDFEGMVADGYPLLQHIPDVEEPASGYIWTDVVAHGQTVYHFGEYISSTFCTDKNAATVLADPKLHDPKMYDPKLGAMSGGEQPCTPAKIEPGAAMPAEWGGGKNLWPWAIPRLAANVATKPELVGHFAPEAPDFNLRVPDQVRVEVFLRHLEQWKRERAAGHDTMPNFVTLRLGNDHTAGTTPGGPTPSASVADNDLAVGRAVEAISHSAYWDDTAFFILEDDAQNGADHVDAHRSLALVVSKYAPHPAAGEAAVVDSRFYSTVSFLRTMEALLGLPPMNNNDAFAPPVASLFGGPGDQPAFTADVSNRESGLIYAANKPSAPGAAESMRMDFRHADRADSGKLNLILWRDAKGAQPPPAMLLLKHPKKKPDDDD